MASSARSNTPGTAYDVCAANNLAIVADGAAGVSIFNIFDAFNPVLIRQLDTPGEARAVACDGRWAVVADGVAGVAIIDLSDPAEASIRFEIKFETAPEAIAAADGVGYVGFFNGELLAVDMASGVILERIAFGERVGDLVVAGDQLYILTSSNLLIYDLIGKGFSKRGSLGVGGTATPDRGGAVVRGRRARLPQRLRGIFSRRCQRSGKSAFDWKTPNHSTGRS